MPAPPARPALVYRVAQLELEFELELKLRVERFERVERDLERLEHELARCRRRLDAMSTADKIATGIADELRRRGIRQWSVTTRLVGLMVSAAAVGGFALALGQWIAS